MDENYTYTHDELLAAIEASLFAAGHPLTYDRLAESLGIDIKTVKKLVSELSERYDEHFGIMLVSFPDSCQLCTKERWNNVIRSALGIKRGGNLSQSLLEVLAIIAYNQPATRAYVDTVRGVDSSYAVSSLLEKNLIEVCGRLDQPGRPAVYRTTNDFLRIFGIESLDSLPAVHYRGENGENIEIQADIGDVIQNPDKQ